MKAKILYVEDDPNLAFLTTETLELRGYTVKHVDNARLALDVFSKESFDLCLFDVILEKDMDGFDLLQAVRNQNKHVPILLITAKVLEEDRIKGLSLGADDYVLKPFNMDELDLRIKVFLKRNKVLASVSETLSIGLFDFDPQNQKLILSNQSQKLTKRETEVLLYFVRRPNTIIRREDILQDVWGKNDYFLGRSLDVFVTRIRKYLEPDDNVSLETIHGVGFRLHTNVLNSN